MAERKTIKRSSRSSSSKEKLSKKSSAKKGTTAKKSSSMDPKVKVFLTGIILVCVGLLSLLSVWSSLEDNLCGFIGQGLYRLLYFLFGSAAFCVPIYLMIMGVHLLWKKKLPVRLYVWGAISIFLFAACLHLFPHQYHNVTRPNAPDDLMNTPWKAITYAMHGGQSGGLFGYLIAMVLRKLIGFWGAAIILIVSCALFFLLATKMKPLYWLKTGFVYLSAWYHERKEAKLEEAAEEEDEIRIRTPESEKEEKKETDESLSLTPEDIEDINREMDEIKIHTPAKVDDFEDFDIDAEEPKKAEGAGSVSSPSQEEETAESEENGAIPVEIETETELIPYTFPPMELLQKPTAGGPSINGDDLRESAKKLVSALHSFGVEAKVLEVVKGPSVTRFELQPAEGVRVNRITTLADDIAMTLAATHVRIEAPIPGKAAVGIEIPNKDVSSVLLREVIQSKEFQNHSSKIAVGLGKDIEGNVVIQDIEKMTHILIAGATGSGKSVCINTLICSILYKADPNEVKLLMVDPKVVELEVYNGIPHLLIPVVTDPRRAAGALNWAVQEMERRYGEFAKHHVRNIKGYNQEMEASGGRKMEQIVIIIDELADLMTVASREVETAIQRLAQKARAAGMHLIIATQRPSVNVITGVIKANIPSRISFAVASGIDSRTILDSYGAEKLLGKGDMLLLPAGESKPTRIQGCFVSDKEVEKIVEFVKSDQESIYSQDIIDQMNHIDQACDAPDPGDADELLPQAIEIVIDAGQASTSMVQRKLKVGYSRAGRLIDQMEERGIIGPAVGSKPREVLITKAEFHEMCMNEDYNKD